MHLAHSCTSPQLMDHKKTDRQCCNWSDDRSGRCLSLSCRTHSHLTDRSVREVCGVSSLPPLVRESHLQPELCPCSLRCMHLRLTAISSRSSVRAVCGVCTSGSQPSPAGAQSAVFAPPAHSHLQPELCPCSLWCSLCYGWLMTGGPDDVTELPDLVRAHRGSLYSQ